VRSLALSANQSSGLPLLSSGNLDDAIVPFNVLETRNRDLLKAFAWIFQTDRIVELRRTIGDWFGVEDIYLAPSGECAIAQILSLLPQKEVVMPAWICHQVKTAAKVAGKQIIFVDLGKNSINATSVEYAEAAKPGRVMLLAHLFGVPTDVQAICELARSRDCITIEDAVPAIGGRQGGRPLGTFADFGVFSFEQSKRIPAFRGGFIVANNGKLIERDRLQSFRVTNSTSRMPLAGLAKAILQNLITSPWIYRALTTRLLHLRPAIERALRAPRGWKANGVRSRASDERDRPRELEQLPAPQTPFYTREVHPYQAALALGMIRRLDKIAEKISKLSGIYSATLRDSNIATFLPAGCDTRGLMRFPIAFPGKDRSRILQSAREHGIHLKVLWSEEIGLEGLPNSLWVARNLVLLPLYAALPEKSACRLAQVLVEIDKNTPTS